MCDDYCMAYYINNVKSNVAVPEGNYTLLDINLPLQIGDLLTAVVVNKYSLIGFAFDTKISGTTFTSDKSELISWNGSNVYFEQQFTKPEKEGFTTGSLWTIQGTPFEKREFYVQFSNKMAYRGRNLRVIKNNYIRCFYINYIEYIDTTYSKDNVVGKWYFELMQPLKYGELYLEDLSTKVGNKVIIQDLYYKALKPRQKEQIIFHLLKGDKHTPMTIINVIICDEGCLICDENSYNNSIVEQMCSICLPNTYSYRNRCYKKCPSYLYTIEDEQICVDECSDTSYPYYSGTQCLKSFNKGEYLYQKTNTFYTNFPITLYSIKETLQFVNYCLTSPYIYYDNKKCVKDCKSKYLYNSKCYDICLITTYIIEQEKKCVDDCSFPYLYYDDRNCVKDCSPKYSYNKKCYDVCPITTYIIEEEKQCVDDCKTTSYTYYNDKLLCERLSA